VVSPAQASESDFRAWIGAGELRRAGEWLVHSYADDVLGLCGAMVRDRSVAEDLAQDVFGRAFSGLDGYRAEASPRTWLLKIARNRCIDHLRAQRRDPWGGAADDGDPDTHPDDTTLPPDLILRRADVEDALEELSEGERALVVLRFKNGLDYAELAHAFGLREGAVRMRVSRALAKMRAALEGADELDAVQAFSAQPYAGGAPPPPAAPAPARATAAPRGASASTDEEGVAGPAAPGAAPPPAPGAPTRQRPGFVQRLRAAFTTMPAPPRQPPPENHPLAAFFAATADDEARGLRERLLATTRQL